MRVLGLDLSTRPGWSFFEGDQLVSFGNLSLDKTIYEYGMYPWNYVGATEDVGALLFDKVLELNPDVVVIEETNLGKSRYAQKTLEFIHLDVLRRLRRWMQERPDREVIYLSSSSWRQALGLQMSKEDKKNNAKLAKAKKKAEEWGVKLDKKAIGVKGKINKKHVALRFVNETFGLNLKVKQNDAADAICLAAAYIAGATPCDGKM
ncbi:hypothetical protein [Myxococcus phage Mx1]|nr:hypothetical protein [Myxococcus phage Mx1]